MIARIKGNLVEVGLTEIVVDVQGVGYQVFIPMSTYDKLPREGSEVLLLIHTHVREDALLLYGFATVQEKALFRLLMTVSGIGAKLALNILSSMPVSSFCSAVAEGDLKALGRINGVGKRSAERLVVELKEKVTTLAPEIAFGTEATEDSSLASEEATLALEQLGFKGEKIRKTVHKIVKDLADDECTSENIIRQALMQLNN